MKDTIKKMSFLEHLEELRRRLIISAVSVLAGMIVCWFFRELILSFLLDPLYDAWQQVDGLEDPEPLNFSSMLEPFVAYLKLSAVGGLFLSAPVILFQIWRFISPGLYKRERRLAFPFVFVSSVLFVGGSIMAYSVVFPIGFRFFLDFAAGQEMTVLESEIDISYFSGNKADNAHPSISTEIEYLDAGLFDGGPAVDIHENTPTKNTTQSKEAEHSSDTNNESRGPSERQNWYEAIFVNLFGQDCGFFNTSSADDNEFLRLDFNWNKAKCGSLPDSIQVKRNGEEISLDWEETPNPPDGFLGIVAKDTFLGPRKVNYSLSFPSNTSGKQLAPMLMVKDYLSFAIRLILAFGLIFELPILIVFLSLAGIVNYVQLLRFSKYFFVIAIVLSAMLTPPDVITQLLLAMPLMILYLCSVLIAYILRPRS